MGKEDWDGFYSYSSYKNTKHYARGSRSRSSSPAPIKQHISWPPSRKGSIVMHCGSVQITEKQEQQINKMKLMKNAEMKKAIVAAFVDSEDGLTQEDVDKIKETFADALDDFIKSLVWYKN
tara:strand:+ start:3092 stop:3454 length:363 start_codon:yes stop_codon:yes gene_type:complete